MRQAVGVIIKQNNKFLLIKRGETTHDEQGKWENVGGKVEPGEQPIQAAIRESKEELGANIQITKEILHMNVSFKDDYEIFLYEAKLLSEITITDRGAVADYAWFTLTELANLDLADYCRSDFEKLGYLNKL